MTTTKKTVPLNDTPSVSEDDVDEIARRVVALPTNTTSSGVTGSEVVAIVRDVLSLD